MLIMGLRRKKRESREGDFRAIGGRKKPVISEKEKLWVNKG